MAGVLAMILGAVVGILRHGVDVLGTIDPALDAERSFAMGKVDSVDDLDLGIGTPLLAIDFRFVSPSGETITGRSFATRNRGIASGDAVTIEFATGNPRVARMQGTLCNPFQPQWSRWAGFIFWPIVLLSILWLRDHSQRKALLALGREAAIEILERREDGRRVLVRYRYRDEAGRHHMATARVPDHHLIAKSVTPFPQNVAAVHDERAPERHRLVSGDDFRP
jgi:hypothetical protein